MSSVSFSLIQAGVKAGAEIRSGDTVVLKVIKPLAGGKWQVSHNGKLLTIESAVELKAGLIIRTKASTSGTHILLRLIQKPASPALSGLSVASGNAIRDRNLAEAVYQAFQKAGLRIDTPLFKMAQATFAKTTNKNRTMASILAAFAEKDISPETGSVDYIADVLDRDGESNGETPRRRSKHEGAETQNQKSLIEQLRQQVEMPGSSETPLHLFNHMKGKDETWILLPYSVNNGGCEVSGTIRLRVGRSGDIRKVAFDAASGPSPYTFAFDWPFAGGDTVKVNCSDKNMLRAFLRRADELPEKLRNLDSINDDNNIEDDCFDGLALEKISTVEGVDKFA